MIRRVKNSRRKEISHTILIFIFVSKLFGMGKEKR
jgi:hypothetical protein